MAAALFRETLVFRKAKGVAIDIRQGGRTWQPFAGGKNGHENFRQACIYNFCDKSVVFARNLTPKGTFFAQRSPKKIRKSRQILIRDKIAYVRA